MKKIRYLKQPIIEDLKKKMVFIGGPRQVGKTTLGISLLKPASETNPAYLNWDISTHKSKIIQNKLPLEQHCLIFDEIHKYAQWRQTMKGLYDQYHATHSFIVTGSARLDHFRKGGDSLLGRYHYYRLHPFSLLELNKHPKKDDVDHLLQFGGFPEPLFSGNERDWKRWQRERRQRVVYEDLRDLEYVKEISLIDLLVENLPSKVGSPLSIRSIKEDLQVSHQSVERWITILENLYMVFRVPPFGAPRIRAVKKEQKLYFWDWSHIPEKGHRFENMVAAHLLKFCHFMEDTQGDDMELRFIRDTDKREIDFVVLKNKNPLFAVECKLSDKQLSPHIKYMQERTDIPMFFQVHNGYADFGSNTHGRVLPFTTFCKDILGI